MKQLLSTNDIVLLSFVQDLLSQGGIAHEVFDTNMSIVEGSIGVLPRRIMVADEDVDGARDLLAEGLPKEDLGALIQDPLSGLGPIAGKK